MKPAKHLPDSTKVTGILLEIAGITKTARDVVMYRGGEAASPHARELLRAARELVAEVDGPTAGKDTGT